MVHKLKTTQKLSGELSAARGNKNKTNWMVLYLGTIYSQAIMSDRFSAFILALKFFLAGFESEHIFWSLANHN